MTTITPSTLLQMRSAILQQNSALQKAATNAAKPVGGIGAAQPAGGVDQAAGGNFGTAMKSALDSVSSLQSSAETATNSYMRGETTDIASVMLAREQANMGFQTTLQVRNKLLSAYKDIMSMPV